MTTLAEHIIVAGAENHPLMLEKSMYDSWASRIRIFIKGKKHGRMMLDSIDNDLFVYPTVKENGQTRLKKYFELTEAQQPQDECDVQAINIMLHGLPPNVYALVNHQEAAKDIWDKGETLYEYYWRLSQLINDMHTIGMTMQQVQVNTNRKRYPDPLAFVANSPTLYNSSHTPQHSGSLMYPSPQQFTPVYAAPTHHQHHHTPVNPQQHPQGEDPIKCINKTMAFLSVVASRFPPSNNQLRTSFNPRNQATIQDGRVAIQQVQGRLNQSYAGEGHMARQCTQPKRPRNVAWFKEKLMLAEAREAGQILDEEQLTFLADPGISEDLVVQQTIPQNSTFQTDDLDAYDSDCDDLSSAKAVLMENLSSCDPEVLFEKTLILEEQSRLKMLDKQNDPISIENKINISPIDYSKLNKIKEEFDAFNAFDKTLLDEITKVQTVFNQMEATVDQCSVDKNVFEIQIKLLRIDNDQLLNQILSQEIMHIVANSMDIFDVKKSYLNAQLQEKVFAITRLKNKLRKLKGKNVVNTAVLKPNATIALGMFKLDIEHILLCLRTIGMLMRITPKKIVHRKETTSKSIETPKPEIKVYSRRPKQIKSVGSSKKAKIVESKIANNSESTHLWGSNATDVPSSSSLVNDMLSRFSSVPIAAAPKAVDIADSPVSTSINQDAPSSRSSSNMRPSHTLFELVGRWIKDHPIANVIDDPSRSISTRKQLKTDAMWCYFDAFLTFIEPKNFNPEMTEPSWIDAMQEEIHKFKRLQRKIQLLDQKAGYEKHVSGNAKTSDRGGRRVMVKEETFQVVIDLIKNCTCFKSFTTTVDVLEIFIKQLWYTIKKVQGTDSYEFLLANKKCTVNAEVFRTIVDICPRVKGVDFTDGPDDDIPLTFLIDLGYKGPLYKHTNMFVDHMHQPWRTLEAIINKCLSGKTTSKDYQYYGLPIPKTMLTEAIKQSESFQMFIKYSTGQICPKKSRGKGSQEKKTANDSQENVDVSKESELEQEPTKKKTYSKRRFAKKVTMSADDNIISDDPDAALKLAKSISKTKAEEAKKARQVHATHARIVTEFVPESAKKKSCGSRSKSVVIQDTLSAPKFKPATSKTKLKGAPSLTLKEQEVEDIMQVLKGSKKKSKRQPGTRGSNKGTGSKPRVPDKSTDVSATSSEGTGIKPGVLDEEKDITKENVILEWGDEQHNEHSDDDNDDIIKDDKDGNADDEGDDHISDTQDADDEDVKTESDEEDIYKYKIHVRKDEDEEMINAEVDDYDKGDEEITDAAKADAEKTSEEVKDDPKKTELPPSSSSLFVSLEVKIQYEVPHTQSPSMLNVPVFVISEPTIPTPVQESPSTAFATTLPPLSQSTTPSVPQQTTTSIPTLPTTIDPQTIKTVVPESNALTIVELRVAKLEKDVSKVRDVFQKELKKHTADPIQKYSLQQFFESSKKYTSTVNLEQGSEKSGSETLQIKREQDEKQQKLKFTIKSTDKATLEEYDLKSTLYQSMHANKSFNRNPANHRLYHALIKELIEDENAIDKGVADTVKDHKRKHDDDEDDDDEDPPAGQNQGKKTKRRRTKESMSCKNPSSIKETPKGKALTKGSKTGKSASTKEPVEEPIAEVVMDDAEGDRYTFDLSKPFPLQGPPGHRTVSADYFSNNDLEYLKTFDPEVTYTSSIRKTKATRESSTRVKGVNCGTDLSVKKFHGYGHLEEIVVKISDQQLYKFKEGDFINLHLNDIKDMLLLAIQHKLFHLDESVIVDFIVALRMFTRSLIIKRRVKDLQLSVESYQKKLNITKPQKTFLEIEFEEPYTLSYDPPGIVYEDLDKQKRVLRADELYKFSNGTLKSVHDEIHHRVLNFRLDYNTEMPKRKWTAIDRKRSGLMIELIDKQFSNIFYSLGEEDASKQERIADIDAYEGITLISETADDQRRNNDQDDD
uniref:Integrase, catalytic region, zinc finger, CCHC-type, peptidase aspartic, catalytic n=1 Tax=Tanacetum cinerariifolium TaxID=118510 RepID=A0A6L2LLV1_TANCI|nr:hypothetical protein [Tanacetum cinerariifolium]